MGRTFDWQWRGVIAFLGIVDDDEVHDVQQALGELHARYRALTLTVDRVPNLQKIKEKLQRFSDALGTTRDVLDNTEAETKTDAIGRFNLRDDIGFQTAFEIRTSPIVYKQVLLSRQFELKVRQFVDLTERRLSHLLAAMDAVRDRNSKGRPRKYSKTFLILRAATIFETHDEHERKVSVNQTNEARRQRKGKYASAYDKGFVPFVRLVVSAIDGPASASRTFGLGKTVQQVLKLRKTRGDADELVMEGKTEKLVEFVRLCDESE
jgi:hypothetical protein